MIVNVAANFETIDSEKILISEEDKLFNEINEKLEKKELDNKMKIIKKFTHIQQHDKEGLLRKEETTLRPLSKLMADVFDQ